jgi:hypothetical protein
MMAGERSRDGRNLLIKIARCEIAQTEAACAGPGDPCSAVVRWQWAGGGEERRRARWVEEMHLPEPWSGHLELAPVLCVGSNPSSARGPLAPDAPDSSSPPAPASTPGELGWRYRGEHPRMTWSDDEIVDFYDNRFETQIVAGQGQRSESGAVRATRFWFMTKAAVRHLLGREPRPGYDYALTEVVRCKSRNEVGVRAAREVCGPTWFEATLARSPAPVVLVLGAHAKASFLALWPEATPPPPGGCLSEPLRIGGRERRIAFLRHPSAAGGTRIAALLGDDGVGTLRAALASPE